MKFTLKQATGEMFVDRKEIVNEMVKTLSDLDLGMGFALHGIRRIGKSSILLEVLRRLRKRKNIVPVYFDLWKLIEGTVVEFNKELTSDIINAYKPRLGLKYTVTELLESSKSMFHRVVSNLKIEARIQEDIEILLKYDEEPNPEPSSIKKVFQLSEELAKETKTRCVLMIDEFPDITELKCGKKIGNGAIKMIRAIYEEQKNTILCISGSSKATMDKVALSSTSPFYRQFIVKRIDPLEKKYIYELLRKNLDKQITDNAIDRIYEFTNGIPYYVQFIGRQLYMSKEKKITESIIEPIINEFLDQEGDILFTRDFEVLAAKERVILKTMAIQGIEKISEIAKAQHEYFISNTQTFVNTLMEKGVLTKETRGVYKFTDPIFKIWLKHKYEI